MNIVSFPGHPKSVSAQPMVAFVDYQREYISADRRFAIADTETCLAASAALLCAARMHRLPILHFRQLRREACFNPRTPFSEWIDGFHPRSSEAVYERALPSIYASADFTSYVETIDHPVILMAGLSGDQACLASAIDAHHRGHRLIFLSDCSASASIGDLPEQVSHGLLTELIDRYVEVGSSEGVIAALTGADPRSRRSAP